jgi:hypothetical protein
MAIKASTLLAPFNMVAKALNDLDITTTQSSYKLLVIKPADIFQCKASDLVIPGFFETFVHVPMAKVEDRFNLFWYLHIPVPISANTSIWIKP